MNSIKKKSLTKKWWFWLVVVLIVPGIVAGIFDNPPKVDEPISTLDESQIIWHDYIEESHKDFILKGLKKLVVENERCKKSINLAMIMPDTGTKENPKYSVMCGIDNDNFISYISKSDVEAGKSMARKKNLDDVSLMTYCETWVNNNVEYGRTADFHWFSTMNVKHYASGQSRIRSDFDVTNQFGGKQIYNVSCTIEHDGATKANIIKK